MVGLGAKGVGRAIRILLQVARATASMDGGYHGGGGGVEGGGGRESPVLPLESESSAESNSADDVFLDSQVTSSTDSSSSSSSSSFSTPSDDESSGHPDPPHDEVEMEEIGAHPQQPQALLPILEQPAAPGPEPKGMARRRWRRTDSEESRGDPLPGSSVTVIIPGYGEITWHDVIFVVPCSRRARDTITASGHAARWQLLGMDPAEPAGT